MMKDVKFYDHSISHAGSDEPESYMAASQKGSWVSREDYTALKAERDALAAENAALKEVINSVVGVANDSQGVSGWHRNGELAEWEEVLPEIFDEITPATDAFLLNAQADGVEKYLSSEDFKISIAVAIARIDGCDDETLDTLVWEGQPPEPCGNVLEWEYFPKARKLIKEIRTQAEALKGG